MCSYGRALAEPGTYKRTLSPFWRRAVEHCTRKQAALFSQAEIIWICNQNISSVRWRAQQKENLRHLGHRARLLTCLVNKPKVRKHEFHFPPSSHESTQPRRGRSPLSGIRTLPNNAFNTSVAWVQFRWRLAFWLKMLKGANHGKEFRSRFMF